ncbi:hypothetical protein FQN49_003564, partial [Arthroderma sp. PD_2]
MAVLPGSSLDKEPNPQHDGDASAANLAKLDPEPEAPEGDAKAWLSLLGGINSHACIIWLGKMHRIIPGRVRDQSAKGMQSIGSLLDHVDG